MIRIYTDGSCFPNPGPGGWGFVMIDDRGHHATKSGGEAGPTTNNRMEMMAILKGMLACDAGAAPLIHSDSQYCVNGMTVWRAGWQRKGYRAKDGGDMPNTDLWKALHREADRTKALFQWVRGHNGDKYNELADKLAGEGRATATTASTGFDPAQLARDSGAVETTVRQEAEQVWLYRDGYHYLRISESAAQAARMNRHNTRYIRADVVRRMLAQAAAGADAEEIGL